MNSEKKTAANASAIFLLGLLYYAWLLFYFFPPQQLGKYMEAARLYGEGKLAAERLLDFSPYLLFFCQLAVMLVFYVSARQHATIVFLFLFFACATLQSLFESRRLPPVLTLVAIGALGFLFFLKTDLMREEDHLWEGSARSGQLSREAYELRKSGRLHTPKKSEHPERT